MVAKPLNQLSSMPQLSAAFQGWQKQITLTKRKQVVRNGLVCYDDQLVKFMGIIQPLSPEAISLKPDGQRSFQWLQIHCQGNGLTLTTDDQIVYNGIQFKVMALLDYSLNGFIEYHCVKDYQNEQ